MASPQNARPFHTSEKPATYRGSLSLLATLVMCFTFLCVVLVERPNVETALHGLVTTPDQLSPSSFAVLAQLVLVPILGAALAYAVAAWAIQLLRLSLYRRSLHRFTANWLHIYAPLRDAGIRLTAIPAGAGDTPLSGQNRMVESAAIAEHSLLLFGKEGAGKTEALHALAFELSRRRALGPLSIRRVPLPILIHFASLNEDALDNQAGFVQFLQRQLRVFGTKGLAAQLPRLLRRGRIILLCDGLDELAAAERKAISDTVAQVVEASRGHIIAVIACGLRTYEEDPRSFLALKVLDRIEIDRVKIEEAIEALRKRPAQGGTRRMQAADVRSALESHRLVISIASPAALAALFGATRTADMWPYGRGELLRAYAQALCRTSAGEDAEATDRKALILGALAISLMMTDTRTLWMPESRSVGRAVVEWLEETPPITPMDLRVESLLIATPEEAESVCQMALARGILLRTADGTGLTFANTVLEATFAAWWLDLMDDGLGRVNAELLQPQWVLPVVLWAGAQRNPADLAARLYRLTDTPESTAARARLPTPEVARATALALALAALCEGLAGTLAREVASQGDSQRATDVAQQHLRDLLDEMQRLLQTPDEDRLRMALNEAERQSGPELADSIAYLARFVQLNRLVRAQLVVLLGALATPAAVTSIVALLDEPDAVIRQAVNSAVVLAGAVCLKPLQAALRSPRDRVRARAEEALALLGDEAIDAAVASLGSASTEQRASAARTLGALRAGRATEALTRRLSDSDSAVRVAAARALGQVASGQRLAALEQYVTSTDAALRVAIAQALGQARDSESLPALLRLLGDTDVTVRAAAADALGMLGDERAVVPLQEHRDDPDPWTQHAVVFALRRLGKG